MLEGLLSRDNTISQKLDRSLRPSSFDEYIGQNELIKKVKIAIQAANERDEPLAHILLFSGPGLGKSTMGQLIAKECGSSFKCITATSLRSMSDLLEILCKLEHKDIFFLDEIHALHQKMEESIYSAIEDFHIDIKLNNSEIVRIDLEPFCLIGATTQPGKVSAPLRDRFGITYSMCYYSIDELCQILENNVKKLQLNIVEKETIRNIASRSRGVPRIANRLLHRVRDYAQVKNNKQVTNHIVNKALELEGIDQLGFTKSDISYLTTLYKVYGTGPCGLGPIAASSGQDEQTIREFIEPYLVRMKYVARKPRGRVLTGKGMAYLIEREKKEKNENNDGS